MTTQHIGAAGELLVQFRLLKLGIDSARLTTDAGIDLVVCQVHPDPTAPDAAGLIAARGTAPGSAVSV